MPDRAERHRDLALLIVAGTVIGLGVWLRVRQIGVPEGLSWDEHHFVENARNYLQHKPDWNDHPPLGKLLITQSIYLFGDHSVAWRLPSLLMGLASIALAGVLGASLFRSWRAGLLAAAFVAGDGFFIAYSRTALLDGVVATFVLAIACAVVRARRPWHIALASVLLGLGCAVKFNVVVMIVPIALVIFLPGRLPRWSALLVLLAPLAYFAIYARGLALAHQPAGPFDVLAATKKLWEHHAALTEMKHPLVSRWFTWLLPTKPISMRYSEAGGAVRAMTSMGNPLLWWAASVGVISTLITAASSALASVRSRLRREGEPWARLRQFDAPSVWLVGLWCLPIVPWVVSRRDSYIYHYLPAYGFAVVLVAGRLAALLTSRPRLGAAGAGLIAATTAWLAPVWCEIPISRAGYELRVWFPGWRHAPSRSSRPPDKARLQGQSENMTLPSPHDGSRHRPRSASRRGAGLSRSDRRAL